MAELDTVSIVTPEGTTDEVLKITNASTVNYRLADVISMAGQYTFSVWAKSDATMNVEFRVLGNVYTESITTAWKKVVFTVDESSTTYIDICPAADTALYLYKGMLQQGQFDTDWKPAPEDVDSEIATTKSLIQQTESSILQQVSDTYATKGEMRTVEGKVELKIGRDENDQIVSMFNASADEINITGDRLVIDSTNFKLAADGSITVDNGTIRCGTEQTLGSEKIRPFQVNSNGTLYAMNAYLGDALRLYNPDEDTFVTVLSCGNMGQTYAQALVVNGLVLGDNNGDEGFMLEKEAIYIGGYLTSPYYIERNGDISGNTINAAGAIYSQKGIAAANDYGFYSYTSEGELVKLCRLDASDNFLLGRTTFATYLYGSTITANKAITTSSDRRLKHDIYPVDKRYDRFFDRLIPVQYRYNSQPEQKHIGLIAQDVEQALKDSGITDSALVTEASDGMKGIAYSELIGLLINEVQALKARVQALEDGDAMDRHLN